MGPIQPFETVHDWERGGGAILRPLQQSGHETDLPPSSAEVKNVWTCTSTSGASSRHGLSLSSERITHFTF